jgi:hypothetical protein
MQMFMRVFSLAIYNFVLNIGLYVRRAIGPQVGDGPVTSLQYLCDVIDRSRHSETGVIVTYIFIQMQTTRESRYEDATVIHLIPCINTATD